MNAKMLGMWVDEMKVLVSYKLMLSYAHIPIEDDLWHKVKRQMQLS